MKKLASLGGLAGVVVATVLARHGQAAAPADPMAVISDVYAWMTGSNLNLVMDVSPGHDGSHRFGPGVAYVFHVTSKTGIDQIGVASATETQVVCRFDAATHVQCWIQDFAGVKDFVDGDPSGTAGVASRRGKVRVFAGRRSDPAFFNATGYANAVTLFQGFGAGVDPATCPLINDVQADQVRAALGSGGDAYAASNVMALVVQLDKSLVNAANGSATNSVVGVWGATHAVP